MTSMQVIVACTQSAARTAHVDSILGTIKAGKLEDLLVLKGDPLRDLNALSRISLVIHYGTNIRSER
jgi:imidazolonepropionase-like amidohydrolase